MVIVMAEIGGIVHHLRL